MLRRPAANCVGGGGTSAAVAGGERTGELHSATEKVYVGSNRTGMSGEDGSTASRRPAADRAMAVAFRRGIVEMAGLGRLSEARQS